jgi:hypothetical protein
LNSDLGGTHRNSQSLSAENFVNCNILNSCRGFLGGLAWRQRETGFLRTRMESLANANAHVDKRGLDIKVF